MNNKQAAIELRAHYYKGGWGFPCSECGANCDECETAEALELAIKALRGNDNEST